jgi:hypothetical protein
MDALLQALLPLGLLLLAIVGVSIALRRRAETCSRSCICRGLLAASIAAACVFVLTYWAAWGTRSFVAVGQGGPILMARDAHQLQELLDQYVKRHGRYPDRLAEVVSSDEEARHYVDPWKNPYQYEKTDKGFRLFSLGRDGKPGGIGLDADFDLTNTSLPALQVTLLQFLFEGEGSGRLFVIALSASACAWLMCFLLAVLPQQPSMISWPRFLMSVLVTTVAAFFVAGCLIAIYLVGSGH